MCVITPPETADEAVRLINAYGEKAIIIGEIRDDIQGVKFE